MPSYITPTLYTVSNVIDMSGKNVKSHALTYVPTLSARFLRSEDESLERMYFYWSKWTRLCNQLFSEVIPGPQCKPLLKEGTTPVFQSWGIVFDLCTMLKRQVSQAISTTLRSFRNLIHPMSVCDLSPNKLLTWVLQFYFLNGKHLYENQKVIKVLLPSSDYVPC